MHDGVQVIARLPYPTTHPKKLAVASEVATMDLVRSHDVSAPKIYDYSTYSDNTVGSEYIIMEKAPARTLGDIWYTLSEKPRIKIIAQVVEIGAKMFARELPAKGSVYYRRDLSDNNTVGMEIAKFNATAPMCMGPDTALGMWFEERSSIDIDRGPREYDGTNSISDVQLNKS